MTVTELSAGISQTCEAIVNRQISHNLDNSKQQWQSELLEISDIRTDGATQARVGLESEVIDDYATAMLDGCVFPLVTVFYDGTMYWLADGFHRLEAAKKIGALSIAADVRQGTRRDALLYSVGANATHGLRRTNADKRRVVVLLLTDPEWSLWSNTAIAKICRVDEGLVRLVKSKLTSDNPKLDHETLAKKCGVDVSVIEEAKSRIQSLPKSRTARRNGKIYTLNIEEIGKSNKSDRLHIDAQAQVNQINGTSQSNSTPNQVQTFPPPTEFALQPSSNGLSSEALSIDDQACTIQLKLPVQWLPLIEAAATKEAQASIETWIAQIIGNHLNQ
jgi:ParB-like nuclease domain